MTIDPINPVAKLCIETLRQSFKENLIKHSVYFKKHENQHK